MELPQVSGRPSRWVSRNTRPGRERAVGAGPVRAQGTHRLAAIAGPAPLISSEVTLIRADQAPVVTDSTEFGQLIPLDISAVQGAGYLVR